MATPLEQWVEDQARLARPAKIHWCDGTEEERRRLVDIGLREEKTAGRFTFSELNPKSCPNSYLHRSHPTDVARTENLTFVCHPDREASGPNNNWMAPDEAKAKVRALSDGCMAGRTMYVLPYMMGIPGSPFAKACVQVTDSVYVAVSMAVMTRLAGRSSRRSGPPPIS
jgi:phosphoenolpyruvate carboxykinase (GTP)